MTGVFDRGCERALAWASLELDGELSQLERVLLATHLRRCDACAEEVAGMRGLTATLRAAPLEPLSAPAYVASSRASRGRSLGLRVALAATLTVVAALLGVLAGTLGSGGGTAPASPAVPDLAFLTPDSLKDQQGVRPSELPPGERNLPGAVGGV
jgi:anti-sigma factor RsiW